jgi:hypothetical protein
MSRFLVTLGLIVLSACTSLKHTASESRASTAVVTSVSNGRMSVPNERMYGLRVSSGRVYFVTQSLKKPVKEGDSVEIEVSDSGVARIRERQ